ncbi:MAG TPA: hypothetical protein VHV55_28605 [Pirellulales bacterium]|jgi:hypothetical protein|nr:hypothetical protein [Pirellulales bacterium]
MSSLSPESNVNPFEPPATGVSTIARPPAEPSLAAVEFQRLAAVLRRTRPWVRVMSVLLFLCCVPMAIMAVLEVARSVGAFSPERQGELFGNALAHGILTAMLFFPARYLWLYASRINDFVNSGRLTSLEDALEAQRKYWKLVTMLSSAFIGLMLLVLAVGAMIAAVRYGA